jgi:hypothetical protein
MHMQLKTSGHEWQKTLRKIVSNPAVEVIAAIVLVVLATVVVVQTETDLRSTPFPLLYGRR